jgi:hypothetical protein
MSETKCASNSLLKGNAAMSDMGPQPGVCRLKGRRIGTGDLIRHFWGELGPSAAHLFFTDGLLVRA